MIVCVYEMFVWYVCMICLYDMFCCKQIIGSWIIMSGYVWIFPDDHKMIRYIDDIYVADDSESSKLFLYEILIKII